MTITEGLAEIRTVMKRIAKKREAIGTFMVRLDALKDPMASEGGSVQFIAKELQAVKDLEERIIELRRQIAVANVTTQVTVEGTTRSIADWLTWRREVAPGRQQHLRLMQQHIEQMRKQAASKGANVVSGWGSPQTAAIVSDSNLQDIVINVSEKELAEEVEHIETVLGVLDGQLSLKNATTSI